MGKGLEFTPESYRAISHLAQKRRQLAPYAVNPSAELDLDRTPVERVRPIEVFGSNRERWFLSRCDDWQFPIFLTLISTGDRPAGLAHLLLPDDVDFEGGILLVRNKPQLGSQVETRNERDIPWLASLKHFCAS